MNEVTMYSGRESKEGGLLIELNRVPSKDDVIN